MKNYITTQEIIDIYKISQTIVDTILKKYKIDTFKGKKGLLINFKDFHKAYTSAYNPSLFSVLDKKANKEVPRKPEDVEKLLKFGDTDGLFTKTFSRSYKRVNKQKFKKSEPLFTNTSKMSRISFDGDVMKEYDDNGNLIYEGGYSEYEGEVVGLGTPICKSGEGKEYYPDGYLKYDGGFYNGKYNGFGVFYHDYNHCGGTDSQKFYEGERKNGKLNGKGIMYELDPQGSKVRKLYEGDWVDGHRNGKGKIYGRLETLVYEGDVVGGVGKYILKTRNGKGKSYYLDTETLEYEGDWVDGKFEGKGKLYSHPKPVLVNGVYKGTGEQGKLVYEGEFKGGKKEGYGKSFKKGVLQYEGGFINGKEKGYGKIYYPNGSICYIGEIDGVPNGKGILFLKNGMRHEGNFVNGKIIGFCRHYYDNGNLESEGTVKDGIYHVKHVYPYEGNSELKDEFK